MPGETWILLRGLSREAAHWGAFLPALQAAMPDATLLPLDLPGAGVRRHDRWPSTIREAMEMVRGEARAKAPPGAPMFLLGVSLGGMVVMEWASRHPSEVAGVVVGASSASDVAPFWKRMRPAAIAALGRSAITRDRERREARIVHTVSNRRDLWDETVRSWVEIDRERPVSRVTVGAQVASASRWRAPRQLDVPLLFLVGERDRLVHPDCTRLLARRYAAPLVEHPDAGHDLTTDAKEWVVRETVRFRRGLGSL
jgi:pimeloyl-ACP methyl ester carboxylesterase